MGTPALESKLRRRTHKAVGLAQDILVAEVYASNPDAILHGGTAIWRCYGGGRFSEDVDLYLPNPSRRSIERLRGGVSAKGLVELKFKETANTIFAKFKFHEAEVSLETAKRTPTGEAVIRPYELLDGNRMLVRTLSPESLILEKTEAYRARRKVRDLYDVLFLTGLVEDKDVPRPAVQSLLDSYRPPVDESQLKAIVVVGAIPTAGSMVAELKRWARRST